MIGNRKVQATVFGATLVLVLSVGTKAIAEPGPEKIKEFMRVKLSSSHEVLDGLIKNNPDQIGEAAKRMLAMSRASEWYVVKNNTYEELSTKFRDNLESLIVSAKDKNLEEAARRYGELTSTCVSCHKSQRPATTISP
jgi:cytochrome c556